MSATDPQFLYMVLILPGLFGLALLGEGLNKAVHGKENSLINIVLGVILISSVIFIYLFFSTYLGSRV